MGKMLAVAAVLIVLTLGCTTSPVCEVLAGETRISSPDRFEIKKGMLMERKLAGTFVVGVWVKDEDQWFVFPKPGTGR